jgi:hypothetical protein
MQVNERVCVMLIEQLEGRRLLAGDPIVNGSFETGDYTGWTLAEWGSLPGSDRRADSDTWGIAADGQTIGVNEVTFDFYDQVDVVQGSPGLPHTYQAADGIYLAYQLQRGPEFHRMYQDVTLPGDAGTLSWSMQYENHEAFFTGGQLLAVSVRDLNDQVLKTLFTTDDGLAPLSSGMRSVVADVSEFAGMTVRLDVELRARTYYFDAAFDDFRVRPPDPVTSLQGMIQQLQDSPQPGPAGSLAATLDAAVTAVLRENTTAARQQVLAFVRRVDALAESKWATEEQASDLRRQAEAILKVL